MLSRLHSRLAAAALLLIASLAAIGQTFRGAITGSVTDATGAVIGGAQVKALNAANGLVREVSTTTSGDFAFQDLPLGRYAVTISHTGFQTVRVDNVEVAVGRVSSVPVNLTVAEQATIVEVAGTAGALGSDSTAPMSMM